MFPVSQRKHLISISWYFGMSLRVITYVTLSRYGEPGIPVALVRGLEEGFRIGENRLCKAIGLRLGNRFREPLQKILPIVIGSKNFPALDSPDDHMVQRASHIYSYLPCHDQQLSRPISGQKPEIISVLICFSRSLIQIMQNP